MFDFADRMVIAAVLPRIKETWQLTDARSGLLSSALSLCMALFALPVGILIDRWSRTKMAGLMGMLWCLASGAGALVSNFPQLLFSRAVVGAGEAGYLPASITWAATAFPLRRRQLALGLLLSSQSVGIVFGLIAGSVIATYFGWRYALGLLAIPGFVVAALIYRSQDYQSATPAAAERASLKGEGLRLIWRTPSLWLVYLVLALLTLSSLPLAYFMPTFFHRVHGVSLQQAAYMSSAIMLLGALAGPLGGWWMDRKSHLRPQGKLAFAISAFGLAMLLHTLAFGVATGLYDRFALLLLAGFAGYSAVSAIFAITQELAPQHRRAFSATCGIVTAHLLGSMPGPWVAGMLSDAYGLTHALLIMTVVCEGLACVILLLVMHFYMRDFRRTKPYRLAASGVGVQ
ncbi:MFS transporter [Betaproteobacteria bacterium]|nr:MFS transporter [Betaproteobacteria bacterium]